MEEKNLSEKESLSIIQEMIGKVKSDFHESGNSSILWGTVVGIAGIVKFLEWHYGFKLPFDIWFIVLIAIIPQVIMSIKAGRKKRYSTYSEEINGYVWITFGISIFGLIFFLNVVPGVSQTLIEGEGWQLIRRYDDGSMPDEVIRPFLPSFGSIFLLLYAFPTLVCGLSNKIPSMIFGAVVAYILFIVSCYTPSKYDMLFAGIVGIVAWLIPGLIINMKYKKAKQQHV